MIHTTLFVMTAVVTIGGAYAASAHENHCSAIASSVAAAGFDTRVTCTDEHAIIRSDTYPDHELMTGIVGTNEQVPVPADYSAPIWRPETNLGAAPAYRAERV